MIIADENLNARFVHDLRRQGYEVLSVNEYSPGISDVSVVSLARVGNAILITEDKDFGELVFAYKIARLTVVFLRYQKSEEALVSRLLLQVMREFAGKEGNFFVTIAHGKIRITEL